ncbi:MAG: DUF3180 domain-containing protein [Bifidobacteriaceae bacterium]|jgi:hypothetical protein|nr:DUF3180 domain-containing protein [Bifidobacteriaceae bacterium]
MGLTRWRTLGSLALAAAVCSWVVVDLGTGRWFDHVDVPWTVAAAMLVIALLILALAWPVHQYVKGKRKEIDHLRAATIYALAKACTLAGAGVAGACLGVVIEDLRVTSSPLARERLWLALAATVAAVALSLAGRLAEWFCRLPPEDKAAGPRDGAPEPDRGRPTPYPA